MLFSCTKLDEEITDPDSKLAPSEKVTLLENGNELITYPNGVTLERTQEGEYILQGDILLADWQVKALTTSQTRGFISIKNPWTDGKIYYEFSPEIGGDMRASVRKAVDIWSKKTNIKFDDVTIWNRKPPYRIRIEYGSISSSYVGMVYSVQRLSLTKNASVSTILHEFGHAIGLEHEHSRPDRDQYVIININNIQPRWRYAFDIISLSDHSITRQFDPKSIMIYNSYTSDENFVYDTSEPMLTKKDGSDIHRSSQPTELDIEAVNRFYKLIDYPVKLISLSSLSGEVFGEGIYTCYSDCTIEAIPNTGRAFVGWYDEENRLLTKNRIYSFTLLKERTFTARFESSDGYCKVEVENPMIYWTTNGMFQIGKGGIVTPGSLSTTVGTLLEFTATPYNGFTFVHWEDMDSGRIITRTKTFSRFLKGDFRVRAVFKRSGSIIYDPVII